MSRKKGSLAKKFFSLAAAIAALAFLLLSPAAIARGIHKNVYTLQAERRAAAYRGNLTLWHIVSFKTGGKSGISLLRQRVARFEKKHPYVFIEVMGLTPEEARQRLERGERADLYSYPLGYFAESAAFLPLPEAETLAAPFGDCARSDGQLYAYPYMADAYVLAANGAAFSKAGLELPLEGRLSLPLFRQALSRLQPEDAALPTLGLSDTWGLIPEEALAYAQFSEDDLLPWDVPQEELARKKAGTIGTCSSAVFLGGQVPMMLLPLGEYQTLLTREEAAGMDLRAFSLGSYTDMVQLIAAAATDDPAKAAVCREFAADLLSPAAQKGIEELLLFPTTFQEELFAADGLYAGEYPLLLEQAAVPSSFRMAAHYSAAKKAAGQQLLGQQPGVPAHVLLSLSPPPDPDFSCAGLVEQKGGLVYNDS
ncbi:MAG: hypothetical protein IJP03_05895 [Christensenellaceae bacterium]|nr:hypothetical protein [Christensenellaceae bacterium]